MKSSRREFIKLSSVAALFGVVGGQLVAFGKQAWAEAAKVVDMSKTKRKDADNEKAVGILSGLGFVENAEAGEKAGKIKRADKPTPSGKTMPAKNQHCNNCALFDQNKIDTKEDGACMLVQVPTVFVQNKGYCNTYSPSPKAKV